MWGYHIESNALRTTPILDVRIESPTVKTIYLRDKLCAEAKPGQFLMMWIPGVDEIPFSILGGNKDDIVRIAIRKVGEATQVLHEKKTGDLVGVRGPFGNSFSRSRGRILMVAGGTGTVPLLFLAKTFKGKAKVTFVLGAKTEKELIFRNELEDEVAKNKWQLITSTEDGTCGIKGLCTEPVEEVLHREAPNMVYACGPEHMLVKIFEICTEQGVELEVSLERLMRCAMGLCGSCVIGSFRVCRDGPVFKKNQLEEIKDEFGFSRHDFDGRKINI